MMNKLAFFFVFASFTALAGEYKTPLCYNQMPTTCSFNDMTLSLCNSEAKDFGVSFSLSGREYIPGGNKFNSMSGNSTCTVKKIKGSEPVKYNVNIEKREPNK